MKTVEIDGKIIHIYDDGSIRIPHEGPPAITVNKRRGTNRQTNKYILLKVVASALYK